MSILPEKEIQLKGISNWRNRKLKLSECQIARNQAIDDCQEALDKKIAEASDEVVLEKILLENIKVTDVKTMCKKLSEVISAHIKRTLFTNGRGVE